MGFVPKDPDVAGCLIDVAEHDEGGATADAAPDRVACLRGYSTLNGSFCPAA